jgi:hypothetical protein
LFLEQLQAHLLPELFNPSEVLREEKQSTGHEVIAGNGPLWISGLLVILVQREVTTLAKNIV